MIRLLTYLRATYEGVKWIMWDDMLRQIDEKVLKGGKGGWLIGLKGGG